MLNTSAVEHCGNNDICLHLQESKEINQAPIKNEATEENPSKSPHAIDVEEARMSLLNFTEDTLTEYNFKCRLIHNRYLLNTK